MAMQAGPLIAELVDYGDVRATVPASTEATFARVLSPSAEQRQAAAVVIDAARTELARVVNRHLRAVRDDPTFEQIRASEQQVLIDAGGVERQLLSDLRSLLTPEQDERYEAFERAHRRSLLPKVKPQGMPVDVWAFLDANGLGPSKLSASENEPLERLLESFDRESDTAIVRSQRALMAYYANIRAGVDGSDEAIERDRRAKKELYASRANMDRVHASVVEPLLAALPKELADRLVLEAVAVSTRDFFPNLTMPERYPVVREVLGLELTPEQQTMVQARLAEVRAEALALARECVVEQARYVLLDNERRQERETSPANIYLGKASELRKALSEEVLAMLTPEQRQAYDASEVLDPSSTSEVKDE